MTYQERLKYRDSIADALADLGPADEVGRVFAGFQKNLYSRGVAALFKFRRQPL